MEKRDETENEKQLLNENQELKIRLAEAEETINAIRNGEVDALIISGADGDKVYSLSSSETPYRIIIEEMNEGAVVLSANGVILYCNPCFAKLISSQSEDIVGSDFEQFVGEEDKPVFQKLLKTGVNSRCSGEITYLIPGSDPLCFNLSFCPLPFDSIGEVCVIASDISGLKLKEKELLQVLDKTEQQVAERTTELKSSNENLSASRIAALNMMRDAVEARELMEILNKNLTEEITERKQAEEELKQQQSLSKAIVDSIPGTFYVLDENGLYLQWNAYQRDEIVGKPEDLVAKANAADTIHPDDRAFVQSKIANVLINGIDEIVEGRVLLRGGPAFIWLVMTGRRIMIKGRPCLVGIGIDITERKQAEEALRASENKYSTLFNTMTEGFALHEIICDADGKPIDYRFLDINPAFERLTGLKRSEIIGQTVLTVIPDTEAIWIERYGNVAITGTPVGFENYSAPLNRTYQILAFCPKKNNFAVIFTDISERKLAEEKLQSSEAKFRTVAQLSPMAIYTSIGSDQKAIYVNESFSKMFGFTMEDVPTVGDWWIKAFPEEKYRQQVMDQWVYNLEQADKNKTDVEALECVCTCKDGSEKIIIWVGKTIGDEFWAFGFDITERKKAEQELIVQNRIADIFLSISDQEMFIEVLKVILDFMDSPFGVFGYIDENGALVIPTMTRQVWDKCNVPEKSIVFPRETWGDSSWPTAIREKKLNYSNEVSNKTPEGHITITKFINVPILFNEEVIGLLQVANKETDYTEADINTLETIARYVAPVLRARLLKQNSDDKIFELNAGLEQRVIDRTAQLDMANKELEAFSYSVSHDLRAPLRHINGFVELLNRQFHDNLPEKGWHYLDTIADAALQMGVLIDDLLQFSRTGRQEMHEAELDMNVLVKEVLDKIKQDVTGRKIKWEVASFPQAHGDNNLLALVWTNLLSNAIKFTRRKEKTEIEIGYRQEQGEHIYFVRDNGAGFDMKYATKLFGVFQRLHASSDFEGTGIGLANVRRIILKHGGRTWAEAEPDKGATFYFTLPKYKET